MFQRLFPGKIPHRIPTPSTHLKNAVMAAFQGQKNVVF
jgi:capsule polysaccharide modification protein KpsS